MILTTQVLYILFSYAVFSSWALNRRKWRKHGRRQISDYSNARAFSIEDLHGYDDIEVDKYHVCVFMKIERQCHGYLRAYPKEKANEVVPDWMEVLQHLIKANPSQSESENWQAVVLEKLKEKGITTDDATSADNSDLKKLTQQDWIQIINMKPKDIQPESLNKLVPPVWIDKIKMMQSKLKQNPGVWKYNLQIPESLTNLQPQQLDNQQIQQALINLQKQDPNSEKYTLKTPESLQQTNSQPVQPLQFENPEIRQALANLEKHSPGIVGLLLQQQANVQPAQSQQIETVVENEQTRQALNTPSREPEISSTSAAPGFFEKYFG